MLDDDDAWLADSEGNLQPEIARAINRPRRAAGPPRPPEPLFDPEAVLAFLRRVGRPVLFGIGILLLLVALISLGVQCQKLRARDAVEAEFRARVLIEGSSLRIGPGMEYPVIERLAVGERLEVGRTQAGWCEALTRNGTSGWIYGGLVGRIEGCWAGPGLVVEWMRFQDKGTWREIKPGERVLVERRKEKSVILILPDGVRVEAPAGNVVSLE